MKNFILLFLFLFFSIFGHSQTVASLSWKGTKKMNVRFLTEFIETKANQPLDSLKLNNDLKALSRLNGIANVTFEVSKLNESNYDVSFIVIENWSILPNVTLFSTIVAPVSGRIGLYDYNFLGRNNTLGGFYQYNGVSSFGINFSAPFLFSANAGIETNFQKLASIEPVYIENSIAQYQYESRGFELLGVYRLNFKNTIKLGATVFSEKYKYLLGATAMNVPQTLAVDKVLVKSNYNYDNLLYHFYLIEGIRSNFFGQYVFSSIAFQNNFAIAWNDFSYFKRLGKTGNWASRLRIGLSSNDESPFAPFVIDNNLNIRGVGNIVNRGTGIITLNTEYRTTLYEKKWFVIQGNAFLDSGTIRKPGGNFSNFSASENIQIYPGVGLRFIHKTIFNAIFRIDYGYGITKNASKGIVFGIGQYF